MPGKVISTGSSLGTTVEVSEIESLTDGHIIIGDGSGAPTTIPFFASSAYLIARFGGTTSSFPALKRSTTALHVRLADDSAFTSILASVFESSGNGTEAAPFVKGNAGRGLFEGLGGLALSVGGVGLWAIASDKQVNALGVVIGWNNNASVVTDQALQTGIAQNAAGVVEINNGTAGTFRDIKVREYLTDGANGSQLGLTLLLDELVTIAAAATTTTAANVPAGSTVVHVALRVTTVIPTAATFDIGVAGATTRYGTGISTAGGTTNTTHGVAGSIVHFLAAVGLLITPNASPADNTGRVRVKVWGYRATAPTA